MAVKSTINLQKDFDLKVREFVGKEMHAKFLALGIKIKHIKKICIKLKGSTPKVFKTTFIKVCKELVGYLEALQNVNEKFTKQFIGKKISEIMA